MWDFYAVYRWLSGVEAGDILDEGFLLKDLVVFYASLVPFLAFLSGMARMTSPSFWTNPVTRHSDMKGPICLGGKFVTPMICLLMSSSFV